jgi:glycosyltransferase involved in cell wall biosynthesis
MQPLQTPFSSKRGVGTYVDGLVRELNLIAGKHHIEYLFNAEFPDEFFECLEKYSEILSRDNTHILSQQILDSYYSAENARISAAESFVSTFIESLNPDVLFSPNLQEGLHDKAITCFAAHSSRFVQMATLHDMVPMHFAEEYLSDTGTRRWYKRKIEDAKRCDRIITVSENSKSDIVRFLGVDIAKVEAIPNGFDAVKYCPEQQPGEAKIAKAALRGAENYILYVGGADKHKNISTLIEAYASLPPDFRNEHPLVLAGGGILTAGHITTAIEKSRVAQNIVLPGFLPDKLLPAVVRQAALFVFPSTHEGFGLPPLEAMACGTPTIGSGASAVGEVFGSRSATFNPLDRTEIARLIKRGVEDKRFRTALRDRGLRRASEFSWRSSAEKLLAAMTDEHDRRLGRSALYFLARRVAHSIGAVDPDIAKSTAISVAETARADRARHVFLDVSSVALYGGNSGIQRVSRKIASNLSEHFRKSGTIVQAVYVPEGTTAFRVVDIADDGSLSTDPDQDSVVGLEESDTLVFLDLHPGLAIRMESRIQRLRALGVTVYHVVYDILPMLMPQKFWPDLQQEFYRWLQCISRSDGLICISHTVASQVAAYLSRYGARRPNSLPVGHFHLGSDFTGPAAVSADESKVLERKFGAHPRFLMVGTLEPRKAHEQTIRAFEEAWERGESWRLVIAGKLGWNMDRLGREIRNHPEFERRLFWFEQPSDQLLQALYQSSDYVLCPSEGEGFGLPLIEAANAGTPVIARDIPVFREVGVDSAFYFADDKSPAVIRQAIQECVTSIQPPRKRAPKRNPLTWSASAAQLARQLTGDCWDFHVSAAGALDLKNPVTLANSNITMSGFYDREHDYTWTAAKASIQFDTDETYDAVAIKFECFSWKRMSFRVFLDENEVFSGTASKSAATYALPLQRLDRGRHRLEIRSNVSERPAGDSRILGIALKQLRIAAKLPINLGEWVNVRNANVVWSGFSEVEFGWRWTISQRASIEFDLREGDGPAIISLFGRAAETLKATFVLNGVTLSNQVLSASLDTIELPPAELREGRNVLEISISGLRAFSEADRRPLGFRILEFKVGKMQSAEFSADSLSDRSRASVRSA